MGGRAGEIGERFALPNGGLDHEVHPLAGALDQTALAQDLGETAVSWVLLVEDVFRRDARQEAAVLAQVLGRFGRVEHHRRIEEGEEDNEDKNESVS